MICIILCYDHYSISKSISTFVVVAALGDIACSYGGREIRYELVAVVHIIHTACYFVTNLAMSFTTAIKFM